MTVTQLLDIALPYNAEDNRCGMKRKVKTDRRMKLGAILNNMRRKKDMWNELHSIINSATFDATVSAWIGA